MIGLPFKLMEETLSESLKFYEKGRQAMDTNDFEDAVVLFKQSILHNPHFKTLELLGECYVRLNRFKQAIVPLAAATTLNKGVRSSSMLAEVFLELEDYYAARNMAEISLSRDPKNHKAQEIKRVAGKILGEA